jgi:hypothetical protein
MRKHFRITLTTALCSLVLISQPASGDTGKAALVIGNGIYESGQPIAACDRSARNVGGWLQRQGFEVDQVLDASSVTMRSAIGNFVTLVSGAPQKTAIVYVCTYASVANQRLFMLPADWDPDQPSRLETQGVILKALSNTLAGTNGVLFADLGVQPNKAASDAIDLLQSELPAGVHLAIVARDDQGIGTLGRGLPALLASSGQDWGRLSAAFQAQYGSSQGDNLAVFAPLTGPMPPTAAAAPPLQLNPVAAVVASAAVGNSGPASEMQVEPPPARPAAPPQAVGTKPPYPTPQHPRAMAPMTANTPAANATARSAQRVETISIVPRSKPAAPEARPRDLRIQVALASLGFYAGPPSGRLDTRTRHAIRMFQTKLGARPSGVLTPTQIVELLNIGR